MEFVLMVLSMIIFAFVGKKLRTEWSDPIYLSGLFWMLYTTVSYLAMKDFYDFSMIGITWINIAFWLMLFAENVADKASGVRKYEFERCKTGSLSHQSWLYLILCCILGFAAFLYQISLYGFHLASFTSLDTLAAMNNTVAVARYSGNGVVNGLTQFLLIFVYAAPACGGFGFVCAEKMQQKLWAAGTMLPSILMVLFTNTKAVVIGAAIFWISAYLVSYYLKYRHAPVVRLKIIVLVLTLFLLFFGFLFFSMTLRMGEVSARTIGMAQRKLSIYAFGSVQSFDWWCANAYRADYKFGTATYLGLANILGLAQKTQGVYTSYFGTSSNVYTVFRGVIEDFGYLLGMFYLVGKAMLCGFCLGRIRRADHLPVLAVVFLVAEMFFLIYGFIISTWTYMSYICAIVVFAGYLAVAAGRNIRVSFGSKVLL